MVQAIRVSNISADTSEFDLQGIFQSYGQLRRVCIPTRFNYRTKRVEQCSFGFVTFQKQSDAEEAFSYLQNYRFDYMIWSLDWAKPRQQKKKSQKNGAESMQQKKGINRPTNKKQQKRRGSTSTTSTVASTVTAATSIGKA